MKTATKATHTPGPWEISRNWQGDLGIVGNRSKICALPRRKEVPNEANARLIAACPTMYDYILKKSEEGDAEAQSIIAAL